MPDSNPLFGEFLVRLGLVSKGQVEEALALQSLSGQRVGEALVTLGYVSRDQLKDCMLEGLGIQGTPSPETAPKPPTLARLGELLVGLKYLTPEQLALALEQQGRTGRRLGELLVEMGFCSYRAIYEALGLQQQNSRPAKEPDSQVTNGAIRVLVVDDSPIACAFVSEGLRLQGFEVHAFQDPFEALEQVSRVRPSIVLSDWEMPGMEGPELCARLKNGPTRAIPVIILTGNDEDAQRVSGLRAGADDYVSKSASLEELGARIEAIVRRVRETERVRKMFARYTSDAVVDDVMKKGEVVLTGEKREVTVLFADIRNFTALAEEMTPEQVVGILNEVLAKLSDSVLACGGTLDKFLGDGLMAVFGAPVTRPDDADRALQSAHMMMASLDALREEAAQDLAAGRRQTALPTLALGIGINSGMAVAGNLGNLVRTEYTVIGDAVNVAARLCALALPGEVLVGERTQQLVRAPVRFEALPPVRVKGKTKPVPLFRAHGA